MERAVARSQGRPGAEDWIAHSEALVLARSGQLRAARRMSRHAIDLSRQTGQRERAATYASDAAVWDATAALMLSNGRDVEYAAAFALALAGDLSKSQTFAEDLGKRFPEDTVVQFEYLPVLRAWSALGRRETQRAIELLQAAIPYDSAVSGISFLAFFGSLYPSYVRGLAYLAAHQGTEAELEFQKILHHRGIVFADPVGAVAQLQLGRAFAFSGNKAKAKNAYQDFLTLWKDADPAIPILQQAKAEYARLQ